MNLLRPTVMQYTVDQFLSEFPPPTTFSCQLQITDFHCSPNDLDPHEFQSASLFFNRLGIEITLFNANAHASSSSHKNSILISYANITSWNFFGDALYFYCHSLRVSDQETLNEATFALLFSSDDFSLVRRLWSQIRLYFTLKIQSINKINDSNAPLEIITCPHCSSVLHFTDPSPSYFCQNCNEIFSKSGESLCQNGPFLYHFSNRGDFALIGLPGHYAAWTDEHGLFEFPPSFAEQGKPLLTKTIVSLLFASLFTFALYLGFPSPDGIKTLMMLSSMIALVFAGSFWSALMMGGGFKPVFRPSQWEKINVLLKKHRIDQAIQEMKRQNLMDHPGFCHNIALAYTRAGNETERDHWLKRRDQLCPSLFQVHFLE